MFAKTYVAIIACALLGSGAIAHPKIQSATPAVDSSGASPKQVSVTFTEKLIAKFSSATITMTTMPGMTDHPPMAVKAKSSLATDGQTLIVTPARPLPAGTYRVDYKLVAINTHKVDGSYSFSIQ